MRVAAAALLLLALTPTRSETATFAGGCFWCVEDAFHDVPGVVSVRSGYTGGFVQDPTYAQVSTGTTGHAESVEVVFDPSKVTYEKLLDVFWENIDPLAVNGQFCDHGSQYRTAIFFHGTEQKRAAEESKKRVEEKLKTKVATGIVAAGIFYPAEAHHQDYARRNPAQYDLYRKGCGRDELLKQIWGVAPREQPKESHP
jgi:peptide-methionine (S)-S-oxide reductase